jgi:hypothetical protein
LLPPASSLEELERIAAEGSKAGPPLRRLGITDDGVAVHVRWTQAAPWLAARVAVGLSTLFAAVPALQRIWQAAVVHVVPLVVTSPALTPRYGFSSHHLKGYVFLSFPAGDAVKDTIDDSLALAHELGHQVLMAYQTADPVVASNPDAPVFSAIRRGFRPAILAVHGAMALGYMTYAAEHLGSAAVKEYREGLRRTLLGMRAAGCTYTELGSLLVSELEDLAWP